MEANVRGDVLWIKMNEIAMKYSQQTEQVYG